MSSGGIAPDGIVYCEHGEEAAKRTSGTAKNPNRDYYCCRRHTGDPAKCNFWYWADQVPRLMNPVAHASTSSAFQSPAPRPGARAQPVATTPVRPYQQQFSPLKSPVDSPQRRKRLQDIQAGLQQREQDLDAAHQAGPSKEQAPSTSPTDVQSIPQPPSPISTEIDPEEPQPRRSFLGFPDYYSPELNPSTIKEEGQPSTPKKRRVTPPTEGTEIQPATHGAPFGGGLLLTPPQTTRRAVQSHRPDPVSPIMHSRKGKEREVVPPVRTQDQDDFSGEPREEDSLPLFTHLGDASSTSSVSPTIAENVLDYNDGIKARMKALSEYMDSFDITQAARSLQTIERQKIQYEYRDRSQKRRIGELTAEKDKLAAEVSRLEEALQRSEERNRAKDEEIARYEGLWTGCD